MRSITVPLCSAFLCFALLTACPDSSTNGEQGLDLTDTTGLDVNGLAGSDAADGGLICTPLCDGKTCGADGCGGTCGTCGTGEKCDGKSCIPDSPCTPSCDGKECGPDGCGGSCGNCADGTSCEGGTCKGPKDPFCGDGSCQGAESCESCPEDCGDCPKTPSCPEIVDCLLGCGPEDVACVDDCIGDGEPGPELELAGAVMDCVFDACGGEPGADCVDAALGANGTCSDAMGECKGSCTPDCDGKACGPDGCGDMCGECDPELTCSPEGTCDDGCETGAVACAGPHATLICTKEGKWVEGEPCSSGTICEAGVCKPVECKPNCGNKQCGPDGCGGSCGECKPGTACNDDYVCVPSTVCQPGEKKCEGNAVATCTPNGQWASKPCPPNATCDGGQCKPNGCTPKCDGKQCGGDGCGGSCGQCKPGQMCQQGQCKGTTEKTCADIFECAMGCLAAGMTDIDCVMGCTEGAPQQAQAQFQDLAMCAFNACPDPSADCLLNAMDGPCAKESEICLGGTCTPSCAGKQCGSNGCGGSCGTCKPGTQCTPMGTCIALPECEPGMTKCDGNVVLICGPDGGWYDAQKCPANTTCKNGTCVPGGCVPSCTGKQCGPNGCGGTCGYCPDGQLCTAQGKCYGGGVTCAEAAKCALSCPSGDIGCMLNCAQTASPEAQGQVQEVIFCVAQFCPDADMACFEEAINGPCAGPWKQCTGGCTPSCAGKQCGGDGCGGSCGTCKPGAACSATGVCVVEPQCIPGSVACQNNAVVVCSMDGVWLPGKQCPADMVCKAGQCIPGVCKPSCANKQCGDDGCGGTCGQCGPGQSCQNGLCTGGGMTCAEAADCAMGCPPGAIDCYLNCGEGASPDAQALYQEVLMCVSQFCPMGDPGCIQDAVYGPCADLYKQCVGGCTPSCNGKQCGNDGCGGSCGQCGPGQACQQGICMGGDMTCADAADCALGCPPGDIDCYFMCGEGATPEAQAQYQEVLMCVVQFCPMADPGCVKEAMYGPCADAYEQCVGGCTPSCNGKQCGSDGCGGSCGQCGPGQACQQGTCTGGGDATCAQIVMCEWGCKVSDTACFAKCAAQGSGEGAAIHEKLLSCVQELCGPNAVLSPQVPCSVEAVQGPCGDIAALCQQGSTCTPSCGGKQCGGDGCGGSCGQCGLGETCSDTGKCVPVTGQLACGEVVQCALSSCSGGSIDCLVGCGQQGTPQAQQQFQALLQCIVPVCGLSIDQTCIMQAINGQCSKQFTTCMNGQTCTPSCDGKMCGPDGCGGSCGSCPAGTTCNQQGMCSGSTGTGCYDMLVCMNDCSNDQCAYACFYAGSPQAQQLYADISQCLVDVCGENGPEECYQDAVYGPCQGSYVSCINN